MAPLCTKLLDDRAHTRAPPEGLGRRFGCRAIRLSEQRIAAGCGTASHLCPTRRSDLRHQPRSPLTKAREGQTPDGGPALTRYQTGSRRLSLVNAAAGSDAGWTVVSLSRDIRGLTDRQ